MNSCFPVGVAGARNKSVTIVQYPRKFQTLARLSSHLQLSADKILFTLSFSWSIPVAPPSRTPCSPSSERGGHLPQGACPDHLPWAYGVRQGRPKKDKGWPNAPPTQDVSPPTLHSLGRPTRPPFGFYCSQVLTSFCPK